MKTITFSWPMMTFRVLFLVTLAAAVISQL
jgi:hypothetical protein